jgi:dCMP deaminase
MEVARLVSTWSKDPSTKVGAILVKNRKIVSTGYNGFPAGIADDHRLDDREKKYPIIVHGEMNALIQAGHNADGSTLYLWGFPGPPCQDCAKHVIQAGVKRIVTRAGKPDARWADKINVAYAILEEAHILVSTVEI